MTDLVVELGHLPLALSHAAAFMLSTGVSTKGYLDLFRAEGHQLDQMMAGDPDNHASTTIAITLLLALSAATDTLDSDRVLRKAAAFAAVMNPNGHPMMLWHSVAAHRFFEIGHDGLSGRRQHLILLDRYSLVALDDESEPSIVRMHALTARAIREQFSPEELALAAIAAADAITEVWPVPNLETGTLASLLRSSATSIVRGKASYGNALWRDSARGLAFSRRVFQSWIAAGQNADAIAHARFTLTTAEDRFGDNDPITVIARIDLVDALRVAGLLDEAIALGGKVVEELTADLDLSISLEAKNNLSIALRQAGSLADAIKLGEEAVAGRSVVLGPDHSSTLSSRNNLAVAYWSLGRNEEAIELHEQVLGDRIRTLGAHHLDTLESRNNLAVAYWQDGRTLEAARLGQEVAIARMRILGDDHPRTLEALHNLTSYYLDAGRVDDAVALGERSLEGHVYVLGVDNHRALNARHVLSVCYLAAGRTEDALAQEKKAVADCLRVLGADNRYTLAAQSNLAACYCKAGHVEAALEMAEKAVADHVRVLGDGHHNTVRARNVLIVCLEKAGRAAEARALAEKTVVEASRVLGSKHPHVLVAKQRLAAIRSL
jgi:tetratricopeptide (TPR) repeat protein